LERIKNFVLTIREDCVNYGGIGKNLSLYHKVGMIIAITGPSGSGKTTLQDYLVDFCGFKKPTNFTTRTPRSDKELDEYVFVTKPQFFRKLDNGDFSEFTQYNGEFYGITKYVGGDVPFVVVLTPA
jgi:guanylate kinase